MPRSRWLVGVLVLGACTGRRLPASTGDTGSGATTSTSESSTSGPETESSTTETESSTTETESSTTETETESTTETETETETSTTGAIPCDEHWQCDPADDQFCTYGSCIDGQCVFEPFDCSVDAPCHVGYCNSELQDWDTGWWGVCQIDYCDVYDGFAELDLEITAVNFSVPSELDIGGEVRIYKWQAPCYPRWQLVRDIASGELLLFSNARVDPESLADTFLDAFGEDWSTLPAPLSVSFADHGACSPVVDDECGFYARANVDIEHADGPPARLLDKTSGWAHGGYYVSARQIELGDWNCIFDLHPRADVFIARDACEGNCPAATFESDCVPPLDETIPDRFHYRWAVGASLDYETYAFDCRVIDASAELDDEGLPLEIRTLDCIPFSEPTWQYPCRGG